MRNISRLLLFVAVACPGCGGRPEPPTGQGHRAEVEYMSYPVVEGKGILSYTAEADGTITVHELPSLETIQSCGVRRGHVVIVDPFRKQISCGGSFVRMLRMDPDAAHQIRVGRGRPIP